MNTYINYDIHIIQQGESYHLRADCRLAGTVIGQCSSPFSDEEISILCWQDTAIQSDPKEIGQRLYSAIFQDAIGRHLRECLATVKSRNIGLRIRICLKSPRLACLPWEYLYDMDHDAFFALSIQTPIVRYLELPLAEPSIAVDGPIHMLVMIADPIDLVPRLDVDREWDQLRSAFQDLEDDQKVVLHRLPKATRQELQRYLRQHQVDIFHFIGHGHFDDHDEEGSLAFENDHGQAELLSADTLARLLRDRMPRLVYLNSCDTAQTGVLEPLAGTAQELVQQGVPAVVAMRTAVQDDKAIQIAHEFYLALIDGYPVDAALVEGRKAIFNTRMPAEWGTPILFMRSTDGILWDHRIPEEDNPEESQPPTSEEKPYNKALIVAWLVGSVIVASILTFSLIFDRFVTLSPESTPTLDSSVITYTPTNVLASPTPIDTPGQENPVTLQMPTSTYTPMSTSTRPIDRPTPRDTPTPKNMSAPIIVTDVPTPTGTPDPSLPMATYIPAGEFLMGSTEDQIELAIEEYCQTWFCGSSTLEKERPQTKIYLDDFWIMKTEVTVEQYEKFIEAGGYTIRAYWSKEGWSWRSGFLGIVSRKNPGRHWWNSEWNTPQQPVISVSWFEAEAYARWLSMATGLDYRLPTEAQWEKAARGTEGHIFPWGDQWDFMKANTQSTGDGYNKTAPVGSFPDGASSYGVLDMAGNVFEWTSDMYDENYYKNISKRNPANTQGDNLRTVRGGAWDGDSNSVRTAYRYGFRQDKRFISVGFRLVRIPSESE